MVGDSTAGCSSTVCQELWATVSPYRMAQGEWTAGDWPGTLSRCPSPSVHTALPCSCNKTKGVFWIFFFFSPLSAFHLAHRYN